MKRQVFRMMALSIMGAVIATQLGTPSNAAVLQRHIAITLDPNQLVDTTSSGVDIVEFSSGFSDEFEPVSPNTPDRLLIHVSFVDELGNPQLLVLRAPRKMTRLA